MPDHCLDVTSQIHRLPQQQLSANIIHFMQMLLAASCMQAGLWASENRSLEDRLRGKIASKIKKYLIEIDDFDDWKSDKRTDRGRDPRLTEGQHIEQIRLLSEEIAAVDSKKE